MTIRDDAPGILDASAVPAILYAPDRGARRHATPVRNRLHALIIPMALLGTIVLAAPRPVHSQAVQLLRVDVAAVAKGYRASKLISASVTNDKNEKIGSLDDIIIDHKNALFAVLQVGGFLGLGGRLVAVPYQSVQISEDGKKLVLPGASKDELKKLSEFKYES
jgi:sporulation protein YlmC with PRC-barrel domain